MTWVNNFLRYCTFEEIRKEAEKRGIIPTPLPPPVIYGQIKSSELHNYLPETYVNHIDGKTYNVRKDVYFDQYYLLTSIDEIKRFLKWNLINKEEYKIHEFDCNSYAIALWGAFKLWSRGVLLGFCIIPGHAKNWTIDWATYNKWKQTGEKTLYEIEPSSDEVSLTKWNISHYIA